MDLTKYIEKTWITSSVWPVHSWSVFMRPTRTNNDVEGWHHRLNKDKKVGRTKKVHGFLFRKLELDNFCLNFSSNDMSLDFLSFHFLNTTSRAVANVNGPHQVH
jgi:hypothetical protein